MLFKLIFFRIARINKFFFHLNENVIVLIFDEEQA